MTSENHCRLKRFFTSVMSILAGGALLSPMCGQSAEGATKPNVIVVLVDDMGYSDLGAFGGEVNTPNIDALAKNGLRFTQNYNSARCCPSRASLLTGLYSHQAGIANFTGGDQSRRKGPAYLGRLNKQCVTLAEVWSFQCISCQLPEGEAVAPMASKARGALG
jgi:hypothetical protein